MFTIRNFEARTLSWWYTQRERIDTSPTYQRRGKLWSNEDKAYLIDSIVNGYDVPKIYLADFTYVDTPLNEQRKPYAIIDGKQRFEAIFDFFAGRIQLDPFFEYADDRGRVLGGLTFKDLKEQHPDVAEKFENFNLSVVSVITTDEAKINELFVRLNNSKPLTGAEVRNAMRGEVPTLIREIAQHVFFLSRIRFQTKRSQDLNAAAKLLLLEFRGAFVDTKRVHLDRLVEEAVQAEVTTFARSAKRVKKTLGKMQKVFAERDPLIASQGVLPVYYWLVRETPDDLHGQIRPFLVAFDREVRQNRRTVKSGQRGDEALSSYDALSRSTNDAGSMTGRYHILVDRFMSVISKTGKK
jgi:hypothetical protein